MYGNTGKIKNFIENDMGIKIPRVVNTNIKLYIFIHVIICTKENIEKYQDLAFCSDIIEAFITMNE